MVDGRAVKPVSEFTDQLHQPKSLEFWITVQKRVAAQGLKHSRGGESFRDVYDDAFVFHEREGDILTWASGERQPCESRKRVDPSGSGLIRQDCGVAI